MSRPDPSPAQRGLEELRVKCHGREMTPAEREEERVLLAARRLELLADRIDRLPVPPPASREMHRVDVPAPVRRRPGDGLEYR